MGLPATRKVKVTNLLNQNDGLLYNFKIEWLPVSGAEGYKIYTSVLPYGIFDSVAKEIGSVNSQTFEFVDTTQSLVATNEPETLETYETEITNITHFVPFYSIRAFTIDTEGNEILGDPSPWVSEEDSRWSCDDTYQNPYMVGTMPLAYCNMKYGLPTGKYDQEVLGIIRQQALLKLMKLGQWVWWFKRKVYGRKCPNVDIDNGKCAYGDKCQICYGTDLIGGYYDPIMIKMVIIYGNRTDVYENLGVRAYRQAQSWTVWQPKIANRDVFVMANGKRCEITEVTPSSPYRGGISNRYDFKYREFEPDHIIYKLPVPGPLARN